MGKSGPPCGQGRALRDTPCAAHGAIRGLALDPRHAPIQQHLSEMGVRSRPMLPFLDRSNFLNVTLGRMFRKGPARAL